MIYNLKSLHKVLLVHQGLSVETRRYEFLKVNNTVAIQITLLNDVLPVYLEFLSELGLRDLLQLVLC